VKRRGLAWEGVAIRERREVRAREQREAVAGGTACLSGKVWCVPRQLFSSWVFMVGCWEPLWRPPHMASAPTLRTSRRVAAIATGEETARSRALRKGTLTHLRYADSCHRSRLPRCSGVDDCQGAFTYTNSNHGYVLLLCQGNNDGTKTCNSFDVCERDSNPVCRSSFWAADPSRCGRARSSIVPTRRAATSPVRETMVQVKHATPLVGMAMGFERCASSPPA
jgi:hypothetical protein